MRISATFLLAVSLFAGACNDVPKQGEATAPDSSAFKQDESNLKETLKKLEEPSQMYTAPGDALSMIRGRKGTVIFLAPDDLETEDGQAPGERVVVELKELSDQGDLARANAQTVSDGKLLVSGGAYYINMTSGGKQLKLKKDKTLKVAFPKITDSSMSLWYGSRDNEGLMNWLPANEPLTSKNGYSVDTRDTTDNKSIMVYNPKSFRLMGYVGNDSTYKRDTAMLHAMKKDAVIKQRIEDSIAYEKEKKFIAATKKLNESLYDITSVKTLGWANIDPLPKEAITSNVTYTIAAKDSIHVAFVYLVYKDLNAMINCTFYNNTNDGTRFFKDIPIGYKARLIAVANRNNELLACKMDLTISKDQHSLIVWKKTTQGELNSYFDVNSTWGQ